MSSILLIAMPNFPFFIALSFIYCLFTIQRSILSHFFTLSSLIHTSIGLIFTTSLPLIAISVNSEGKEEIEKDEPC